MVTSTGLPLPFPFFLSLLGRRRPSSSFLPTDLIALYMVYTMGSAATHTSPCLFSFLSFPFSFFLFIHRKGYPCNSGVAGKRTAPEGSKHAHATQGYEQNLPKACWQGRRQGSLEFFLSIMCQSIYQLGNFIV